MKLTVICLWLIIAASPFLADGLGIISKNPSESSGWITAAVNAVLGVLPEREHFVTLITQTGSAMVGVGELRAPGGVGLFQVAALDGQDGNVTQAQVTRVFQQANRVWQVSVSITVVVVSDDPAFLHTLANRTVKGRLLVLTRLRIHNTHPLLKLLAMSNSMLLLINDIPDVSINIYIDLPFSLPGSQLLLVASWTPHRGLTITSMKDFYLNKFSRFDNRPRLSVGRVTFSSDKQKTMSDPDAPGETKLMVFNPENILLETIAESMNFSIKYVRPADGHWGILLPNGSWTGMVGLLLRQEVDISLGLFTMTPARNMAVGFTYPATIIFVRMFAARGSPEIDPWGYLLPFGVFVWVAILVVLAGVVVLKALLASVVQHKSVEWFKHVDGGFIRVLLQQDVDEGAGWWWWERVVVGVWMLTTLVLTKSYAGNLISQLAVRYIPEPIQSLQDALDSPLTIIINGGTSDNEAFKTAESGVFLDVWNLRDQDRLHLIPGHEMSQVPSLVRSGDMTHFTMESSAKSRMSREFSKTGQCEFYIGDARYLPSLEALAVARGSPLLPVLSQKILQAVEGGLYDYWYRMDDPNLTICLNTPTKIAINSALTVNNIWGMLVVLAGGSVSSLLVFCLEFLFPRFY